MIVIDITKGASTPSNIASNIAGNCVVDIFLYQEINISNSTLSELIHEWNSSLFRFSHVQIKKNL